MRFPLGGHQPPYSPDYGLTLGEQVAIGKIALALGVVLLIVLWLLLQKRRTVWGRVKNGAIEAAVTGLVVCERYKRWHQATRGALQKRVDQRLG